MSPVPITPAQIVPSALANQSNIEAQLTQIEEDMLDDVDRLIDLHGIISADHNCMLETIKDNILRRLVKIRAIRKAFVPGSLRIKESVYEKAIIEILGASGRLTFEPLYQHIEERGHKCHMRTIKRYLKSLMRRGIIDNVRGEGYGLVR